MRSKLVLSSCYITAFLLSSCTFFTPGSQPKGDPSSCIVTAPQSLSTENQAYAKAEADLTLLGVEIIKSGIQASTENTLSIIYNKVPDHLMACQMMLQLGACMADNNRGVTPEYISLIDRKNSCGESDLNIARRVGMPVYIHISDESQLLLAKKIQIDLSDKGFSVPTIENRHGKVPNLNEIRYYYTEQFQDAKLIKKVSTAYGLEDVLIKPLYAFPTKPTKERAFIEVWLAKPKLPEN